MEILSLKTYIEDNGQGEPILFLHGWGSSHLDFKGSAKLFSKTMRTINIDLWGFGKSQLKEPWNCDDYVEAIYKLVKKLKLSSIHIVGHSFGGKLAIKFCYKYPDLCKTLILVDSAGIRSKFSFIKYFRIKRYKKIKKLVNLGKVNKNKLLKYGSTDFKNTTGVLRESMLKIVNENCEYEMRYINKPTLIVWGNKDKTTPLYMGKKIKRLIKNSKFVILKGEHFSHIDNFVQFNEQCLDFWRNYDRIF